MQIKQTKTGMKVTGAFPDGGGVAAFQPLPDPALKLFTDLICRADVSEAVQKFFMEQINKIIEGRPDPNLSAVLKYLAENPNQLERLPFISISSEETEVDITSKEVPVSTEKSQLRNAEIIEYIKAHYHKQVPIKRVLSGKPMLIEGYVNLAIVGEEEQRKWEKGLLNKEYTAEKKNSKDQKEDLQALYTNRISSFEDLYRPQKPIDLDRIFTPLPEDEDQTKTYKRLLVLGRAGIGKTTLCKHIVHQWLQGISWLKHFPVIFWIPLREVVTQESQPQDIAEMVYQHCLLEDQSQITLSEFRFWYTLVGDQALHLLDGFDEVTQVVSGQSIVGKCLRGLINKPNVLLTSRPLTLYDYTFDRRLETMGFTNENIEKYIQGYYADEKKSHATRLLQVLRTNPSLWGIAHVPINLELLCGIWEDKNPTPEHITMTMLYEQVVSELQVRHLERLNIDCRAMTPTQVRHHPNCQQAMKLLKELAFRMMQSEKLLVPQADLHNLIDKFTQNNVNEQLVNEILAIGLLKSTSEAKNLLKQDYYFIHLTFQEYLAAEYIVDGFLVSGQVTVTDKPQNMIDYIANNKYDPSLEVMWWFAAGILYSYKMFPKLNEFFDLLNTSPLDIAGFRHIQLLTRCLGESQCDERIHCREALLTELKEWIVHLFEWNTSLDYNFFSGVKITLSRILHLSCAVLGKKGLECFFLQEISQGDIKKKERVLITLISIKGNWPHSILNEMMAFIENNPQNKRVDVLTTNLLDAVEEMLIEEQDGLLGFFFRQLQAENVDGGYYRIDLAKSLLKKIERLREPYQTQLLEFCFQVLQAKNIDEYHRSLAKSLLKSIECLGSSRQIQLLEFFIKQLKAENVDNYSRRSLVKSLLEKIEDWGEQHRTQLLELFYKKLQAENVGRDDRRNLVVSLLEKIECLGEPHQTQLLEFCFNQLQTENSDDHIDLALSLLEKIECLGELHQTQLSEFCFNQLQAGNVAEFSRRILLRRFLIKMERLGESHRTRIFEFFLNQLQAENLAVFSRINLVLSLLEKIECFGELRQTQLLEFCFNQLQAENAGRISRQRLAEGLLKKIECLGELRQTQLLEFCFNQLQAENADGISRQRLAEGLLDKIEQLGAKWQRSLEKIVSAIVKDSSLTIEERICLDLKLIPKVKTERVIALEAKILASKIYPHPWNSIVLPMIGIKLYMISLNKCLNSKASPLLVFFLALKQHSAVITCTQGKIFLKTYEKDGLVTYEFNDPDAWKSYLRECWQALYDWLHFVPGMLQRLCEGLGVVAPYKKRTSYQIAVTLDPTEATWWDNYISFLSFSRYYIQAVPLIEQALYLDSQSADLWLQKVFILDGLHQFSEAQDCLDKAIQINPARAAAYWNKRAWHLCYLNEYHHAEKCIRQSLTLTSDDFISRNTEGWIALFLKDLNAAKLAFDQALSVFPNYYFSLQGKRLAAYIEEQGEEAKSFLTQVEVERFRETPFDEAEFYYFRAKVFALWGMTTDAIHAYQEVLKTDYEPSHACARRKLEELEEAVPPIIIPLEEVDSNNSNTPTITTTANLLVALKTDVATTTSNLRTCVQKTLSAGSSDSTPSEFTQVYWDNNKLSGELSDRNSFYSQDEVGGIFSFPAQITSAELEFNGGPDEDQSEVSGCCVF